MSKNPKIRTAKEIEQIFNVLRVVMATIIALLFAFLVILLVSDDPMGSISSFIVGPLTTFRRFGEVVSKVVPLLFTGAAVCFIFSANQTNMAVEGGFTVGALGATIIAVYVHPGNTILHIALCCIAGGVFGMIAAAHSRHHVCEVQRKARCLLSDDELCVYVHCIGPHQPPHAG